MEVILDTNFIISCVKRKIDFISRLREEGFNIKLPREVLQEMKDLRLNVYHDERVAIDLAFDILSGSKDVKKINLGKKKVDESLIELGKKGAYIATLDRAIKHSVPNKVIISDSKNDILIQRS